MGDIRVMAVAACEGRICSILLDGTIRVWNRPLLEEERTLPTVEGHAFEVDSLGRRWRWEGHVIGGYLDGRL